jgi:hypothetical protein
MVEEPDSHVPGQPCLDGRAAVCKPQQELQGITKCNKGRSARSKSPGAGAGRGAGCAGDPACTVSASRSKKHGGSKRWGQPSSMVAARGGANQEAWWQQEVGPTKKHNGSEGWGRRAASRRQPDAGSSQPQPAKGTIKLNWEGMKAGVQRRCSNGEPASWSPESEVSD